MATGVNQDFPQVLKNSYDPDLEKIRVEALISDGTDALVINPDGSINVNSSGTSTISGTVDSNINGLNTWQTSQYNVGTTAVQLAPSALTGRSSMSIKTMNTTNSIVYVGNSSSVTTLTGYALFNGDSIQMDLTPDGSIWAISNAPGQIVFVLEIG